MLLTLVLLAQTATATPSAKPAPTPTKPAPANPFAATYRPSTAPRALGDTGPRSDSIGSVGSKVKLDKSKAATLFRDDAPAPTPAAAPSTEPARAPAKPGKDAAAEMLAADDAAEKLWTDREADRRSRYAAASQNAADVCARYHAAAANAGMQDGRISDAAGAMLGALQADCNTATRKADEVAAEKSSLEESCRKTPGCKPGWLR